MRFIQQIKRTTVYLTVLFSVVSGSAWGDGAQYQIMLGNRQIGLLAFEEDGRNPGLRASLGNTPLGLADGTFSADTIVDDGVVSYRSESRGSKNRDISATRRAGRVTELMVVPPQEMTGLSDARKVPSGVVFPTEVLQELVNAGTCPMPMTMYDGRRVVQIVTTAMTQEGNAVRCELSYRVVLGPGHLAPFYFNSLKVQVMYSASKLTRITVTAGIFRLHFLRQ